MTIEAITAIICLVIALIVSNKSKTAEMYTSF